MLKHVLILGSGFSGMWAAIGAMRLNQRSGGDKLRVSVLSPEPALRIRPRFYEENVSGFVAPLKELFAALSIESIRGVAKNIDKAGKKVSYIDLDGNVSVVDYDRLIVATGSQVICPDITGLDKFAFNIDQLESARALEQHLDALALQPSASGRNTVIICGGGFTGIELATELPTRLHQRFGEDTKIRVIVVDRGAVIGGRFSEALRGVIAEASDELGIEWRLNSDIESIDAEGVTLKGGERILSATVVWTAGIVAHSLTQRIESDRDHQGRLLVNEYLQLPNHTEIYATGDTANASTDGLGNTALMTCQHAIQLGKFAGHNAAASLLNLEPLVYQQLNYVTCLDLGAWGAVYTEGWEQAVKAIRSEAKKIKIAITNELIYPPAADPKIAFSAADPLAKFV